MKIHATFSDVVLVRVEHALEQSSRVESLLHRRVVEVVVVDHAIAALLGQIVHVALRIVLQS